LVNLTYYENLLSLCFTFVAMTAFAQLGINALHDASAALHIESVNSGVLIPRMTQAQINALRPQQAGLLAYNGI
jgi:hypothetical protein